MESQVVETASPELSVDDAAQVLMDKWDAPEEATEEVEEAQPELEASEEPEVEAEAETEEEAVEEEDGESDDQEAETNEEALNFQSVQELAEAVGMPLDEFLASVSGTVKVDGQESEVSLSELRDGYQRQSDYQRKTADLAETRRQFEQQAQQQQVELQQRDQAAQATLQAASNSLMQEFNNVNWQELEYSDPGQAALLRQKFGERQNEIQVYQQHYAQQQQQETQVKQQQDAQAIEQFVAQERQALETSGVGWTDDTSKQVSDYMTTNGFAQEEVSQLVDHRHALLVRKAMLYDQQQANVDVAKAKVKTLPKMLKPGVKRTKQSANAKRTQGLRSKLSQSGSMNDAAALLLERM